jgi:hypothetical protein
MQCRLRVLFDISLGVTDCWPFQVGRPTRLNTDEAEELESQWQDFGAVLPA